VPADIGAGDFTIELWVKANAGENASAGCGEGMDGWIYGNILLDRDIWGGGDYGDFGLSVFQGGLAFGVRNDAGFGSLCGGTPIDDGAWHHVAVTRDAESGLLALFVDGQTDVIGGGPAGDLSYRDGRPGMPADPYLVIGAEKHDAGPEYPSFHGWVDEIRLSTVIRYDAPFTRPTAPFSADDATAALYHLDEGVGFSAHDVSGAPGGPSDGVLHYGGDPAGPLWSGDTPFGVGSGGTCPPNGCGVIPPGAPVRWVLEARPNPSFGPTELFLRVYTTDGGLEFAVDPSAWTSLLELSSFPPALRVLDVQGRVVATVEPFAAEAGLRFLWDGRTRDGRPAPRGIYFASLAPAAPVGARILLVR
jgi:hypothetical protein